jgi:hypothetical protein
MPNVLLSRAGRGIVPAPELRAGRNNSATQTINGDLIISDVLHSFGVAHKQTILGKKFPPRYKGAL